MPISTNAPFNEFGQSQILRDIEQLYLALNGAGNGAPGDGQTQDQSGAVEQDISGLATLQYVDESIAAIPGVTYPISVANGGTGASISANALQNLGAISSRSSIYTTSGTFTIPANVYRIRVLFIGGGGGGGATGGYTLTDSNGDTSYLPLGGGAGGSSAFVVLDIDVSPGEVVTYTVGAGGAAGGTGGDGGASVVAMTGGLSSFNISASGGRGGRDASATSSINLGGDGGYAFVNSGSVAARNGVLFAVSGSPGSTGCVDPNTVGAVSQGGASVCNGSSMTYGGYGGLSVTTGSLPGLKGFVCFTY